MSLYQTVTDQIVAQLEQGTAPWIKPWKTDSSADRNLVSEKPYRGINRLLLGMSSMAQGYSSPVWATFQQWKAEGANVRKGEKATHIVFFKPVSKESISETTGEKEVDSYRVLKGYCVFNAAQVDGLTMPAPESTVTEFERHERAESTIVKTGAIVRHGGDAAFYAPSQDAVQMPNKGAFLAPANYYATAFHELTHWTGAKHRLDRDLSGRYGNPEYAFEELVAEMGAAFMCADHGIKGEIRHAAYIASWIKALRENERAIFKASSLAQKAADYLLSLDATSEARAA